MDRGLERDTTAVCLELLTTTLTVERETVAVSFSLMKYRYHRDRWNYMRYLKSPVSTLLAASSVSSSRYTIQCNYNRWESVKCCTKCLGRLDLIHMLAWQKLRFYYQLQHKPTRNSTVCNVYIGVCSMTVIICNYAVDNQIVWASCTVVLKNILTQSVQLGKAEIMQLCVFVYIFVCVLFSCSSAFHANKRINLFIKLLT